MDHMQTLLADLSAPVKSFRLFALEQLLKSGIGAGVLKVLEARRAVEDDEECLLLLEYTIRSVRKKTQKSEPAHIIKNPEDFVRFFSGLNQMQKLDTLGRLTPRQTVQIRSIAPQLFSGESVNLIRAKIIQVFGPHWPENDRPALARHMGSRNFAIRIAALEVMIKLAPASLLKDLPRLLTHSEPRIRAIAVQGLAQIDLDEAVKHFITLLFSDNPNHRTAALQILIFFPLDRSVPLLHKYLAFETDPGHLERICAFLANNPDSQTPFRLWEIAFAGTSPKREILSSCLNALLHNLELSWNAPEKFAAFKLRFHEWSQELITLKWLQKLLLAIRNREAPLEELDNFLWQRFPDPIVTRALRKCRDLDWPKDLAAALSTWIERFENPESAQQAPKPVQKVPYDKLSLREKCRLLATFTSSQAKRALETIQRVQAGETDADLLATALRVAFRLDFPHFKEFARKQLNKGQLNLVAAAMEYLGKYDPEWILPHIGKHLHSNNVRLRSISVKALANHDPTQALNMVKTLLYSPTTTNKRMGMACLVYFEFPLIRDMLFRFIENHPQSEMAEAGVLLFRSNPDQENLYLLYQLERNFPEKLGIPAHIARQSNLEILQSMGLIGEKLTMQDLDDALAKRYLQESTRSTTKLKAYSVDSLQKKNLLGKAVNWFKDILHTPG
jgi:hypothetical protein